MSYFEIFILAVALSMDAFAVAICAGLSMPEATVKKALVVGLYFGVFQAVMPLAGFFVATLFADKIIAFDHWIAFLLLGFLGGKMISESLKKDGDPDTAAAALGPAAMLPLALATSIDALAVGVSFAFLHIEIIPAVSIIGVTTLVLSTVGVKVGAVFGKRHKAKAELAGGIVLALIGVKILFEHLGVIAI